MSKPATPASFTIIHGFGEGPRISRNLRRELVGRGFRETHDATQADIIIAHSAGCLEVPDGLSGKLILLANPSPCPKKRVLLQAMSHKVWLDFRTCLRQGKLPAWARKSLWNIKYIVTRPIYFSHILRLTLTARDRLPQLGNNRIVVINSQYDPWAKLFHDDEILRHRSYCYITYPGSHDQIWLSAGDYAEIIQSWHSSVT